MLTSYKIKSSLCAKTKWPELSDHQKLFTGPARKPWERQVKTCAPICKNTSFCRLARPFGASSLLSYSSSFSK